MPNKSYTETAIESLANLFQKNVLIIRDLMLSKGFRTVNITNYLRLTDRALYPSVCDINGRLREVAKVRLCLNGDIRLIDTCNKDIISNWKYANAGLISVISCIEEIMNSKYDRAVLKNILVTQGR